MKTMAHYFNWCVISFPMSARWDSLFSLHHYALFRKGRDFPLRFVLRLLPFPRGAFVSFWQILGLISQRATTMA